MSDHQPNRGLSRLPVRVPIPVHVYATPDVKTTDIHARRCRCTHECIRTYTWACACTCTSVHSTCKPEKSSYPISKAKGKMAAMLSLQQHIMRAHTCTYTCTCACTCTCTYTCMYIYNTCKPRKSYLKHASNHKGKNQDGHHAKHANNKRCIHTCTCTYT